VATNRTMKKIFLILLIIPTIGLSQKIKKADLKALYNKTVETIKNNDSLAFFNLWEHCNSHDNSCEGQADYLFHKINVYSDFRRLRTNWPAILNKIKLQSIEIEKAPDEDIKNFGQPVTFFFKHVDKKDTVFGSQIHVSVVDKKLVYSLNSTLPDKIIN
jgi:hypothetical protein